jgi:hypothetical protein
MKVRIIHVLLALVPAVSTIPQTAECSCPVQGPIVATFTSLPVADTVTGIKSQLGTELATATPGGMLETVQELPTSIEASEDDPVAANLVMIQVVFDQRLHYSFVIGNITAARQIFEYLPQIIEFAEKADIQNVRMVRLLPLHDTKKGWLRTAAYVRVPISIVTPLQADLYAPNSLLYRHHNPIAFALALTIDPSFGVSVESQGGETFTNREAAKQTPIQQGKAAGIAIGSVVVATGCGVALFTLSRKKLRKWRPGTEQQYLDLIHAEERRWRPWQ